MLETEIINYFQNSSTISFFIFATILTITIKLFIQTKKIKQKNKKNFETIAEEKIKKGKNYEYKCKSLFENKGYKIYPNGFLNGKNDNGIDLICYKEKEVLLVQCKNWISPPKQDDIKIFIANADLFLKKNNHKFKNKNIRKIFITSCNKKDYGVEKFLESYNEQNEIKVEYIIYKE